MKKHSPRAGFSLFQLLLVLAVLIILLAMLLPALVRVRAAAEQTRSTNNLKQLVLGLHAYNDANAKMPPGVDNNHFSASAYLLPYIEQQGLYNQIDFKKSIDDKANAAARKVVVVTFLSPNDPIQNVKPEYGATNYLFNDKIFFLNSAANLVASIPDGTSNTIAIGETLKGDGQTKAMDVKRQYVLLGKGALKGIRPDAGVQDFRDSKNISGDRCDSWMDGRFLKGTFNGALRPNSEKPDVSCAGLGGVSALRSLGDTVVVGLADGSTKIVNAKKITLQTWRFAMDPADGNVLGPDW
jgi:type II secretory pathway pseudopilin PulG